VRWWRLRKARKQQKIIIQALVQIHYLAVTVHGRRQLQWVLENTDEDEVPDIMKGLYVFFLENAPVAHWAIRN